MQTVSKIHVYNIKISVSGGQQQEIRMKSTSPEKKEPVPKQKLRPPPTLT